MIPHANTVSDKIRDLRSAVENAPVMLDPDHTPNDPRAVIVSFSRLNSKRFQKTASNGEGAR